MNRTLIIRKIIICTSLNLILSSYCFSQERKDIGIQAGGSYYMGDYNYGRPFYQTSPSFGIVFRYNTNNFYSFRLSGNYSMLKGSYSTFSHYLPGITSSFNKSLFDVAALFEMNFMSFNTKRLKKDNFTPYVFLGLGGAYLNGEVLPQFPFGIGIKYCPLSRVTIGWEWRLSKTFTDNVDNYNNVYDGSKAIFHNNDWYSFFGIFVTYRVHNKKYTCPVYQ